MDGRCISYGLRGVEITLAVQDSLETQNYQLAKTLLYKTFAENLVNKTVKEQYNLHHIIAKYVPPGPESRKAYEEQWSIRIVEILDENNVPAKNVFDQYKMSPLHYAVKNRHVNLSKHHITKNQLDPETPDGINNEPPLVTALYNDDLEMVKMLVQDLQINVTNKLNERNMEYRKDGNQYPIHICCIRNNLEICKILLNHGASAKVMYEPVAHYKEFKNRDRIVLHTAVRHNNHTLTQLILENGADVNALIHDAKNIDGYIHCLHLAAAKHDHHMIDLLLSWKAQINVTLVYDFQIRPLDESSEKAKQKDIDRWRSEYQQIHNLLGLDQSVLHIACRRFKDYKLTRKFIEHGANVNLLYRKQLLLMRAKNSKKLNKDFAVDTSMDQPDLCLLHTMVRSNNTPMIELLLEHGADTNIKMCTDIEHRFGECTTLHTAVRANNNRTVDMLLKSRADANQEYIKKHCKNSDLTPLHTAIRKQNEDIVKLLLKAGARVDSCMIRANSEYGEVYGIHMAVKNSNLSITQALLKHSANPNKRLCTKRSIFGDVVPIHMAVRSGNYKLTQLLLLYGANPNIKLKPKPKDDVIWKWQSDAGWKEYDKMLNILIEKQYQSYIAEKKSKAEYLKEIEKSNINLTIKKKPDEERIKKFNETIKHKSIFCLNCGTYFESHHGYFIDFSSNRQSNESRKHKHRAVKRYQHPFDFHHEGGSTLWMAVRNRDIHLVQLLVNYHCDMNVTNIRNETPLIFCIQQNDLTLVAILMRGAIHYTRKYQERIVRGLNRRQEYFDKNQAGETDEVDTDHDSDDVSMTNSPLKSPKHHSGRKRSRTDREDDTSPPNKKRKVSTIFIPIDVNQKCDNDLCALHYCVITDGEYNASYENVSMMRLLVKGQTARTQHFLETKVDALTPYKQELTEQEQKHTELKRPTKFKSRPRSTDVNQVDKWCNPPIYYALLQKSGKMKKCLLDLGAKLDSKLEQRANKALNNKIKKDAKEKQEALHKMYGPSISEASCDVLADARKWRKKFFVEDDEIDNKDNKAEKVEVDFVAKREIGKKGYVLTEGNNVYNWDGLYVNVDKGKYGAYMFYKMQLLYKPIQKLTLLWCRWGRPGETGNYQRTPYTDKDEAIREFKKIFQSKTMNEWENRSRDKFVPKKWRMVRKKRRRYKKQKQSENSSSSAITPHNLVNSIKEILRSLPKDERPKSALPTEIANFICTVFDTAALTQSRRRLRLNDTAEQLGYLEDEDLDKCYELIQQISKLVSEQDEQNDKTSEMNKNKWKLEREIRERNAKRQRNKNLFDRNQQRLQQEVNKVNAMIRSIKLNITTLEQQDQETLNDSSKKQTLKTKQAELRQKESEKQAKLNEIEDGKVEEEKRVNEENNAFGPLDEEDKKKITEIDDQLNELQKLTEERKKLISHLSNEYFLLMPREEFVNTYITAIDHRQMVNKYLRIMMSLCEHQVAISALMAAQFQYLRSKIHPIDYCYISLKCKILPIRSESYEFKLILSYINRTASPKILPKKLKIFEIWKENEEKLFEKYANYDNRMLLWHGSDTSNVAGILTKGLKIAPPEADATGYMFGKGVYFADAFQKSMGYASTGNQRNAANLRCLFLCRVALGKMFEAVIAEYMEDVKPGFHSTKGLGRKGPNPSNIKTTFDGAIIPDSETIDYPQRTMRDKENNIVPVPFMLNWNEYVVYNEEQAKLEYLIIIE